MLPNFFAFLRFDTPARRGIVAAVLLVIIFLLVLLFALPRRELTREEKQGMVAEIVSRGDIDRCSRAKGIVIDNIQYETVCRNNVAYQRALKTLDLEQCKLLDNNLVPIEMCMTDVLVKKMDQGGEVVLCDSGVNEEVKNNCRVAYWSAKAIRENDVSFCDQSGITLRGRLSCRYSFGKELLIQDPSAVSCGSLERSLVSDCENMKRAVKEQKTDFCSLVTDSELRSRCMQIVSK